MKLQDSFVRRQLEAMSGVADKVTLSTARKAQDAAGSLIRFTHRNEVVEHEREKNGMRAVLTVPRDELRGGIILYLHGGGYTCGGIEYAVRTALENCGKEIEYNVITISTEGQILK